LIQVLNSGHVNFVDEVQLIVKLSF